MHIQDYLKISRSYWRFIVALTVLGLTAGLGFSALQHPVYSATSQVFVSTSDSSSVSDLSIGNSFTQEAVKSYAPVAESRLVLRRVIARLGLSMSIDDLRDEVSTEVPLDTAVLKISVRDRSPQVAAAVANAISGELAVAVASLSPSSGSTVKLTQIDDAVVEPRPVSPNFVINGFAGLLGGALIASLIAIARSLLDTRLHSEAEVAEVTDLPTLGLVPHRRNGKLGPQFRPGDSKDMEFVERFRSLRTNLQFFDAGQLRSIVIISTVSGEGKTTTAVNLASVTAATTKRVLLMDGDLRRPTVARYLGIDGAIGLTEVLIGRATLDQALQHVQEGALIVLPAGTVPPNPSELLQSPQMADLLEQLRERFDLIVIDAPPVLSVTDALILGKQTDGVLLVCAVGRARRSEVAKALATLRRVEVRVLGTVATMLPKAALKGLGYATYTSNAATVEQ